MKTEITGSGVVALAGVAVVAGLGVWAYANRKEIAEAVQVVNPASDKNIVYRGANAATQAITGQSNTSFGSWLYDVFHPNQPDVTAPTPGRQVDTWDKIVARRAAESLGLEAVPTAPGEAGLKMTPQLWMAIAGLSTVAYLATRRPKRRR
jgi:hypothetical protein